MLLSDNDIRHFINLGEIEVYGDITSCGIDIAVDLNHKSITLQPGDFILAKTKSIVSLPNNIAGLLGGRSRYARRGLLIHCTSALIAPGFNGNIVLEVKNIGNDSIKIMDGEKICSLSFLKMFNECRNPYCGKYQGQTEAKK